MAFGIDGSIGTTIIDEHQPGNGHPQFLGRVGNAISPDNPPAVEVRGSADVYDASRGFQYDFFQARAGYYRSSNGSEPDDTPVSGAVGVTLNLRPDQIGGIILSVWDGSGNLVYSGFDLVVGSVANEFTDGVFDQIEALDSDFSNDARWSYSPTTSVAENTFVIGIGGFVFDLNGNAEPLNYTMNLAFS